MADFVDQSLNEHLCMTAARYCGLASARTEMALIDEHRVLVVHRFDRLIGADGAIRRVHQEDMHQACGDPDASIYQGDHGEGHSIAHLSRLLADNSADPDKDKRAFFDALALSWVLCNTDAHSKNYSILFNAAEIRPRPSLRCVVNNTTRPRPLSFLHSGDVASSGPQGDGSRQPAGVGGGRASRGVGLR